MLEAMDLTVRFGASTLAVNNVSIAVKPGKVLTLCGPNGAGKSTLLAVLAGDLKPTGRSAPRYWQPGAPFSNKARACRLRFR